MQDAGEFDIIVTGAGSAGCAVAGRLAEGGRSVLLLEAGPRDRSPWIHIPAGMTKLFTNERYNWRFESEPVEALNGRTLYQPRGKVLGGTSSINGTVYMRGTPGDYDEWRQRGNEGWDWDNVLPMFKRAQDQSRGESEQHGTGGPLKVSDMPYRLPLTEAMVEAAVQAGIPRNPDFNGPEQEGTGYYQFTATNKRRWSSARAYLRSASAGRNLTIRTEAHATRIEVVQGRAGAVQFSTPGGVWRARARAEIVVSGGAFGSPQLLEVSGIGAGGLLSSLGIEVVHDLPAVGENLHDHFNSYLTYRCSVPSTLNDLANSPLRQLFAGAKYVLQGAGPLTNTGVAVGAFVRTDERLERPDMQINMLLWSAKERRRTGIVPFPFSSFTLSPVHLRPDGRGTVHINSPDPLAPPAIQFQFLVSEYDRQAILYGTRLCRKIASQPALAPFIEEEIVPGPAVDGDDALLEDVRARAIANYHPVGTCRMGNGPDAVVDARLRVHGLQGLRVADASIMPQIIAGNTNAPSIMIGEKAAQMILEDTG